MVTMLVIYTNFQFDDDNWLTTGKIVRCNKHTYSFLWNIVYINYLNPVNRLLLGMLIDDQSRNSPSFIDREGLVLYSHEPITGPLSEPTESIPHLRTQFT